jgi:hypothetical protein
MLQIDFRGKYYTTEYIKMFGLSIVSFIHYSGNLNILVGNIQ